MYIPMIETPLCCTPVVDVLRCSIKRYCPPSAMSSLHALLSSFHQGESEW